MKTTDSKSSTYVGNPVERVEDSRFLRGRGQYLDDIDRVGQWHAAIFRSEVAHGIIRSVNVSAALALPGIHAILTAADMEGEIPIIPFRRPNPTIGPFAQPVIARDKVRYVGEPIAIVLAENPGRAEDALQLIEVAIESLPAVIDRGTATDDTLLLFESVGSNFASTFTARKGDAKLAFETAAFVLRDQFSTQRQTALPMETRGLLAEWDTVLNRLTMYGAAKLPFFNRKTMATMMGMPEEAVDYIELDVGGGFGARGEFYPEDYLTAFAARKFKRPVKWIEDRREHLMAIGHAREASCDVELALDKDGTILALRGDLFVNVGAYVRPNGMTPVRNAAQFMSGPYRIPNVHLEAHAFVSNKTPSGTYRGPGRYEGCFFIERLIEIAAHKMGVDSRDIRRRNLLTDDEMPYSLAPVLPSDGRADTACDSGDYRVTFDLCMEKSGWAEKAHLQGQLIDGRYQGLGIACFIEGGASGPQENARMNIELDGSVSVFVGSSAIGQGLETIMSQIAADALELSLDRIRIFHGSTTYLREGWGSYGSRGTVMGGSAVLDAATKLKEVFIAAAARRFNVAADDVRFSNGTAHLDDGRSIGFGELTSEGLAADGSFRNSKPTYTYGTAVAHVAVDVGTGHVQILDYTVVDDVGRVINPLTLHGQILGAVVQGFGSVFSENLVYDSAGQLLVGSLADYRIPLATDYPRIHCVSMESYPSPNNPLGAKGAGEGGIIPVGGAVTNAIAAALRSFGVEPRDLPLSPPRLWELIDSTRNSDHKEALCKG
jgi:carbon-monoxide dehydrogenase large subunit